MLHLTGSKLGCGEGGCGACTVMISRFDGEKLLHYSVNACLMPVLAVDGMHVTTIEQLGSVQEGYLHPIQKAMVDLHGSQCGQCFSGQSPLAHPNKVSILMNLSFILGFCTPGIIMAIYSLFANNSTKEYVEEHLDGNLCRCTGYRPIWDAARALCIDAKDISQSCGISCSECSDRNDCESHMKDDDSMVISTTEDKLKNYFQANQDWNWLEKPNEDFPKALIDSRNNEPLMVVDRTYHNSGTWFKATTLVDLLSLLKRFHGQCKLVVGNTEVGIGK